MPVPANGPVDVATNLRRQVHFARLIRPGRDLRIDVYAHGRPPGPAFALPLLSPRSSRVPIPGLGVVGLDPTLMVQGGLISLTTGQDVGVLVFRVAPNPSLIGATVFTQAVLADGAGVRLTNTQREIVVQ